MPTQAKTQVDKVEGADAAAVTARVEKWEKAAAPGAGAPGGGVTASLAALDAELDRLVNASPVMLFMKGTPSEPRCKFSRAIVDILKTAGAAFGAYDILTSDAVRAGLKDKAAWPTYPMLFVRGTLIGGLDIVTELRDSGELATILPKPPAPPAGGAAAGAAGAGPGADAALRARLDGLINSAPVVLFMKGTPDAPACGYSERAAAALAAGRVAFTPFDVLADPAVREGLKTHHATDTPAAKMYPQLYVRGKLIGGWDAIEEITASGRGLAEALGAPTVEPLADKLARLINSAPVTLFMKGTAAEPRCGFSARAVETLRSAGVDVGGPSFASVDVLADAEVREGIKAHSNWPTFPQLYVNGTLVGGLDIMKEMAAEGELAPLLAGAGAGAA
jgi:Grx4 family monothiol glutaredoxin